VGEPAPLARRQLTLDNAVAAELSGSEDEVLRRIEERLGCEVHLRGNVLTLDGAEGDVAEAARMVDELVGLIERGHDVAPATVGQVAGAIEESESAAEILEDVIWRHRSFKVAPKTVNQKRYVDAIRRHTVTFGIGPAGTGKTFLAMAVAVRMLLDKQVRRIIVSRPAIEAGERLGFLPGTLEEKISPYLRPLYDALHDMVPAEKVLRMLERETLEIAPLAYMRGRTLNDAFVILDEAQNTTREQMKMFLTRMGANSRVVVTGDPSQIDLPGGQRSGLVHALRLLQGVEGIAIVPFGVEDVMRHPLVQQIVTAYDRDAKRRAEARERADPTAAAGTAGTDPESTAPGIVPDNAG
jgi:phosphate starvation-inducible PhoH-like protein